MDAVESDAVVRTPVSDDDSSDQSFFTVGPFIRVLGDKGGCVCVWMDDHERDGMLLFSDVCGVVRYKVGGILRGKRP